jgi:uncharacterized protein
MSMTTPTTPVVLATDRSPYARLHPLPVDAIRLDDRFWEPRRRTLRSVTLPSQRGHLERTGRIENFRRASGRASGSFEGLYFNDSDVYKWLEAASWTLATTPDARLERMVDDVIAEVAAAQQPDGYLDTYHQLGAGGEHWTELARTHELYCAGHLFQAAVAHHRATGRNQLLEIALRFADHICHTFGPDEDGKRPGTDGHPEVEMGLVELARETGERRYLEQARYFLDARGYGLAGGDEYRQDHLPFRRLERIVGHAVRAIYLAAGAADIYTETGEPELLDTLTRLWDDMTIRRMYVTGGIGSRRDGEAFGDDYELPNSQAYAETCAAIASVMWNWRMLSVTGDPKYADLMETTLYNAFLPGISLDGHSYFYDNPLADDGRHRRQEWFACACCPPNIARLLASLPGYLYSVSDDGVWVHLFARGEADVRMNDGRTVRIRQQTDYPWQGDVSIDVDGEGTFTLRLRVPAWCGDGASLEINGTPHAGPVRAGDYASVDREWRRGDRITLRLPMPVRLIEAHPYAIENVGRVAVARGPIVYCAEAVDNPGVDPRDVVLPTDARFSVEPRPDLLGGVTVLSASVAVRRPGDEWNRRLYRTVDANRASPAPDEHAKLTLVPYFGWANRAPGRMNVWLRATGS